MDNMKELNLNELEEVSGGKGGSKEILPRKEGFICYQIEKGDTLGKLAKRFGTSVAKIMDANVGLINNQNDISRGRYIYIPR